MERMSTDSVVAMPSTMLSMDSHTTADDGTLKMKEATYVDHNPAHPYARRRRVM